ncbi:MAG: peptidoglycan DD-metalloendopeptidase family protein [Syntrophomonadaceae bacterium]|jgi:murein DD-endopeptidase MepM/ murein hydrolase activator NlpD|nr:peptidoglycan DD-metalloendopeptidase family protein [Syntrophomonadaceae bacterium]
MADYLKQTKPLERIGIVSLIIVILSFIFLFSVKTSAYSVYIDGQEKFAVRHYSDISQVIEQVKNQEEDKCNRKLELSNEVTWDKNFVDKKSVLSQDQIAAELQKSLNFVTLGVEIQVEGKAIACLENMEAAEQLLKDLKSEYSAAGENEKVVSVSLAEDVDLIEKKVLVNELSAKDKALELIKLGADQPVKYIVKEGDNLWSIARKNDMYVDDIMCINNLENENLQPDQELVLVASKPYINIVTQVEGETIEPIPFETKTEIDKNSSSSVRIKQAGINGEKQVSYVATKVNGVVETKEVKEETVLKKAVDKIIVKGTRVTVASRGGGSGTLDWPVYGPISSYYGSRGGSHTGLDIAAPSGSTIKAVDSGTVTSAGYKGTYGYMITISHGNGMVTRYAHCSAIHVSAGQYVAKGEGIGKVGSTGKSTGPHLHFEILVNGSFRNPLSYLR